MSRSSSGSANLGSLADLQRAFQDYLLASSDGFVGSVRNTRKASRELLLGVYRDAYQLRLIEVLGIDYPGVRAMVGSAAFDELARAYIAAHPSHHPSVRWFGAKLADFLNATLPHESAPALAEMARFEWLLGEAFDAPDAQPVEAAALMALPPQDWMTLSFKPMPSLRRLTLAFAGPSAYQRRDEVVEPDTLEVAREERPVEWAIWRPQFLSLFRSLEPDEAVLLDALIAGRAFPEICEAATQFTDEAQAAARTAGLLRSWVEEGMIAGYGVGAIP